MEATLERLFADRVRELTSASQQVVVSYNGSSVNSTLSTNLEARTVGVETFSYLITCRARSRAATHKLVADTKTALNGLRPVSISPLIAAAWIPSTTWLGETPDGFFEVALNLTIRHPYVLEDVKIC